MSGERIHKTTTHDVTWRESFASTAEDVAWAADAIIYVRAVAAHGATAVAAKVQISPDGKSWVDEGSSLTMPYSPDEVTFVRVRRFGRWLRIVGMLPPGANIQAQVTIDLKS